MTTTPTSRAPDREPLPAVARQVGATLAAAVVVVTLLASGSVLTIDQADAATRTLGALDLLIPGVVSLIAGLGTLLSAFGVARIGRRWTTPMSDPRDDHGRRLVPVDDDPTAATAAPPLDWYRGRLAPEHVSLLSAMIAARRRDDVTRRGILATDETYARDAVDALPDLDGSDDTDRSHRGRPQVRERRADARPERVLSVEDSHAVGELLGLHDDSASTTTPDYDRGRGTPAASSSPERYDAGGISEPPASTSDSSTSTGTSDSSGTSGTSGFDSTS